MKIAYLANVRFPSERANAAQIANMCQAFKNAGVPVTLFTNKRSSASNDEVSAYYHIPAEYEIKRISHGIFLPHIKLAYYLTEIWFATTFLITSRPADFAIIYSRQEWIVWFLSLFIKSNKLVWESHEAKLNFPGRRILKKEIKTVVISEGIYNDYILQKVPQSQLHIAHDGIDESFFDTVESKAEARTRLGLPQDKKIAMYIGGFEAWKGVKTFFVSAKHTPDVMFVAVGGKENEIRTYKATHPEVTFLGQLPYAELRNNQQAADVLVIPNSGKSDVSAKYTSPLKLFAHMASGVPIVASDVPSLRIVVGDSAVTFSTPDDVASFSDSIKSVFLQYQEKQTRAQELKEYSKKYTWTRRAESIIEYISCHV